MCFAARGPAIRLASPGTRVDFGLRDFLLCRAGCQVLVERFARLPVEIDVASEFRYREAPLNPGGLAIFVSQSGETADTLATLRYAKEHR